MSRSRRPKGFTLVELLVVISIIGLLIALLLPALRSARDAAQTMKCMSTQRQLLMASFSYAADNRDYIHPRYYNDPGLRGWYMLLRKSYITAPDSFWKCPADWTTYIHTYVMNTERSPNEMGSYPNPLHGPGGNKFTEIVKPGRTYLYTDRMLILPGTPSTLADTSNKSWAANAETIYSPFIRGDYYERPHHKKDEGSLWAFADGHAANVAYPRGDTVKFSWWKNND